MTRKLSLLLVLALFLVSIVNVTVFAAKAKQTSNINSVDSRALVRDLPATPIAGAEEVSYDPSIGKPGTSIISTITRIQSDDCRRYDWLHLSRLSAQRFDGSPDRSWRRLGP